MQYAPSRFQSFKKIKPEKHFMLWFIITLQIDWKYWWLLAPTLKGLRHWFDMVLAQQFPSLWGNRSILADLYALSLHGVSEQERKGDMYWTSHRTCFVKKCVFKNFAIFTGKHLQACNFIKKRLQRRCFLWILRNF